jgi:hydroxymethylpyrimidine pyrophosphatase-like HAD family hydrolase
MIFLNSSRSYDEIKLLPKRLFENIDGIISCAGAMVIINGSLEPITINNSNRIIENLEKNKINYRYVTSDNHGYLNKHDEYIENLYMEIYGYKFEIKEYENESLVHIHYFPENNDIDYENKYSDIFKDCNYILTSRSHECFNKKVDKGLIVKMISERYGIVDTYGIGDGFNDVAMIKMCKTGIAMGNGKQVLKDNADYITETLENEGFYKAMEHYGLIGAKNV